MLQGIIDSHAHYDDEAFDADREQTLEYVSKNGVISIINCGTDVKTSEISLELAQRYPFVFAAVGIHPESVNEIGEGDFEIIKKLAGDERAVAIGEIGLDYHWDMPRDIQQDVFQRQLIMAQELDLPVIVHDREAHEDTLKLLKKHPVRGVMHCFSGSAEMAREMVKMGMYIGIGGVITFKNARKIAEVALNVPLDRILLETDCPYMAPVPYRGKRNDSSLIQFTAQKLANVLEMDAQELVDICSQNTRQLFDI